MRFIIQNGLLLVLLAKAQGAEIQIDFDRYPLNETPADFRGILSGQGKPGDWKIVLDDASPALRPPASPALPENKRKVLAQLSTDSTDERFPVLLYNPEVFGDFKITTRFKIVGGIAEQMAGIAFRVRDEKNYYYVRASCLGNTFRFFKIVDGQRSAPIGPDIEIRKGVWHELAVECKGNQIRCRLNGKEVIPTLTDNTFSTGRIGFWTKSDSISYFADAKIAYTPREAFGQALIREILGNYPRLVGLKVFASASGKPGSSIIASDTPKDIGTPSTKVEQEVIDKGVTYYGKGSQTVTVTLPLHDRNGESIGAVRVIMKSFIGQTEQNAVARALPIIRKMESKIRNAADLLD